VHLLQANISAIVGLAMAFFQLPSASPVLLQLESQRRTTKILIAVATFRSRYFNSVLTRALTSTQIALILGSLLVGQMKKEESRLTWLAFEITIANFISKTEGPGPSHDP